MTLEQAALHAVAEEGKALPYCRPSQELRAAYDFELQIALVLESMTRRGLWIDLDELTRIKTWAKEANPEDPQKAP